jgi:hypothetical protein
MIFVLVNPSDPYTFEAPNIEIAAAAVVSISPQMGATSADGKESTPVLFGWQLWLEEHGMIGEGFDFGDWHIRHTEEIAAALESFLIGGLDRRADVLSMLEELPPEKREAWRAKRQDRERSSMNQIGERAYQLAKRLRERKLK